jgi:hypothetical protein
MAVILVILCMSSRRGNWAKKSSSSDVLLGRDRQMYRDRHYADERCQIVTLKPAGTAGATRFRTRKIASGSGCRTVLRCSCFVRRQLCTVALWVARSDALLGLFASLRTLRPGFIWHSCGGSQLSVPHPTQGKRASGPLSNAGRVGRQIIGSNIGRRLDSQGFSDEGRLSGYRSTLRTIADRPCLGTFEWAFPPYRSGTPRWDGVCDLTHNTPLQLAAEVGSRLRASLRQGGSSRLFCWREDRLDTGAIYDHTTDRTNKTF